ncbi:MAG: methyl-accepting chemotaxis protein [Ruminococcus sp.]|jgi:methyl-accepting chemotaxis protein|nr:methyl-accepting chemotaxis protein [Ruminococcus sp.]
MSKLSFSLALKILIASAVALLIVTITGFIFGSSSIGIRILTAFVTFVFFGAAVGAYAYFLINKEIAAPVSKITDNAVKLAQGDLSITADVDCEGEMRLMEDAMLDIAEDIKGRALIMGEIAKNDYTVHVTERSDHDKMNINLNMMIESINLSIAKIQHATHGVSDEVHGINMVSKTLAERASNQASTIQELTANVSMVAQAADDNVRAATITLSRVAETGTLTQEVSASMKQMLEAMRDISERSNDIGKVISVIEDIAFQTNILALNASIEAARAGDAGKGFAVVADEVATLAAKSAEAAKETAHLIDSSLKSVRDGNLIVKAVNTSLRAVTDISEENIENITKLQKESTTQSKSVTLITDSISELSAMVQENAATAEESAASARELENHIKSLQSVCDSFKVKHESHEKVAAMMAQVNETTDLPAFSATPMFAQQAAPQTATGSFGGLFDDDPPPVATATAPQNNFGGLFDDDPQLAAPPVATATPPANNFGGLFDDDPAPVQQTAPTNNFGGLFDDDPAPVQQTAPANNFGGLFDDEPAPVQPTAPQNNFGGLFDDDPAPVATATAPANNFGGLFDDDPPPVATAPQNNFGGLFDDDPPAETPKNDNFGGLFDDDEDDTVKNNNFGNLFD